MSNNSFNPNQAAEPIMGSTDNFNAPNIPQDRSATGVGVDRVPRVSVPNVDQESSPWNNAQELEAATDERLRLLSRAVASASGSVAQKETDFQDSRIQDGQPGGHASHSQCHDSQPKTAQGLGKVLSADLPEDVRPFWEEYEEVPERHRLAGIVETILDEFPIQQPRTILFAGIKNEMALDEITAEVAQLLARRRVGKVLLADANVGTAALSQSAGALNSAGLLDAIEGIEPWQSHLQTGAASGLEFLPLGQSTTGRIDQAAVGDMVKSLQPFYQFTCLSVGNFDAGLAPMFIEECDGCFLLIDMSKVNKTSAKNAVEKLNLAKSKMLGCVALGE